MTKVVVIKFKNGGKLYYFSPRQGEVYERNMPVVVETARGLEFAWVAYPEREVEDKEVVQPLKPIIRIATQRDKEFYAACEAKKPQAMQVCKEKIAKHGLEMKLVEAEYTLDRSKIMFYFTADGRVDFRELVKDLAGIFHTRIELRQIGVRDEAKMMTPEQVARIVIRGIEKRKRLCLMEAEGRATHFIKKFAPGFLDRMFYMVMAREPDSPLK